MIPHDADENDDISSIAEEPALSVSTTGMIPMSTMSTMSPSMMNTYRQQT